MKFIDETSFNTAMARRYARAHKSERAIDRIPRNQGKNQTLICALQLSGPTASFVIEGAVDGDAFVWYVEHFSTGQLHFFIVPVDGKSDLDRNPVLRGKLVRNSIGAEKRFRSVWGRRDGYGISPTASERGLRDFLRPGAAKTQVVRY